MLFYRLQTIKLHPFVKFEPIFLRKCTHFSNFAPIHPKMHPLGFCILFIDYSQIRTQKRIQLFVPILRFLLLFKGILTIEGIKIEYCNKKNLFSESFGAPGVWFFLLSLKLWVFVKI